jgi:23S rRNA U2552 (ribose-2'-O)-methylase RlmE/FtsJ
VQVVRGDALRGDLLPLLRHCLLQPHHRGRTPSVLLSDMAPSFTGEGGTDQLRQVGLALAALRIACAGGLAAGGNLCLKARYGQGYAQLRACLRARFRAVAEAKPPASRAQSAEAYLVATGFVPGVPWSAEEAAFLAAFGL